MVKFLLLAVFLIIALKIFFSLVSVVFLFLMSVLFLICYGLFRLAPLLLFGMLFYVAYKKLMEKPH